jgi:surfactin synthase thioesterase subunit
MSNQIAPVSGRWLQPSEVDPDAELRLFLFHYAGGAAPMWRGYPELMPADVAVQALQYPGRQDRFGELAYTSLDELVEAIREELVAELDDRPYAFLGHCMGAQVAYRTAIAIERSGDPGPALLGAMAWCPEGFRTVSPEQADMSQEELVGWIRSLGSLPEDAYTDPALLALIIPAMRADLTACANWVDDGASVSCPVVSYSAREDPLLPRGATASWAGRTPEYLGNVEFPGGHFFVHQEPLALTTDFLRLFRRYASARSAI